MIFFIADRNRSRQCKLSVPSILLKWCSYGRYKNTFSRLRRFSNARKANGSSCRWYSCRATKERPIGSIWRHLCWRKGKHGYYWCVAVMYNTIVVPRFRDRNYHTTNYSILMYHLISQGPATSIHNVERIAWFWSISRYSCLLECDIQIVWGAMPPCLWILSSSKNQQKVWRGLFKWDVEMFMWGVHATISWNTFSSSHISIRFIPARKWVRYVT